jgi:aspartate carbamoyltransferase catalytic subunit
MARAVLSVTDLSSGEVDEVLARARQLGAGAAPGVGAGAVVGLVFLDASLRTRSGFAAAAARAGVGCVDVIERRSSPTSMVESLADTLQTVAGYVDAIVVRPGEALDRSLVERLDCGAVLNGGDVGPRAEHPSQALIDLHAMQSMAGDIGGLRVAIWGDLRMRSVRSLLGLLSDRPPASLTLVSHRALADPAGLPRGLGALAAPCEPEALRDVDVLYVAGMPHECLPLNDRERLIVTQRVLDRLPNDAVVLSPMPVIDEIDPAVRADGRIRLFEQNRLAQWVRIALLERLLS